VGWGGVMGSCGGVRDGASEVRSWGVGRRTAEGACGSARATSSARRPESFTVGLPRRVWPPSRVRWLIKSGS
jgi:hypothetical protein